MALGKKTGGRGPNTPNKVTREFRETVRALLESNADNVAVWLQQVAEGVDGKPDPGRALDLLAKLAEYASPKLARTEHTGADGDAIKQEWRVDIVHVAKPDEEGAE
jgi:hypothetical protein